jgi:hypothetical protein
LPFNLTVDKVIPVVIKAFEDEFQAKAVECKAEEVL